MHAASDSHDRQLRQFQPMVTRMAYHLVSRLPASVEVDDLVQAGMMGLSEAISRCEPSSGELERFARFRIKGAMIDELRELDWVSRHCRQSARRIDDALQRLQHRLCRRPTDAELAAELDITLEALQLEKGRVHGSQLVQLDDMDLLSGDNGDDEDHLIPGHLQFGDWNADPLVMLQKERRLDALGAAILRLPPREQEVMVLHYTLDMKFKEIGQKIGVSESRVCQLHRHAVELLRARLHQH
jgi:RNA polymerase sigma factor for flagellar operon FliA